MASIPGPTNKFVEADEGSVWWETTMPAGYRTATYHHAFSQTYGATPDGINHTYFITNQARVGADKLKPNTIYYIWTRFKDAATGQWSGWSKVISGWTYARPEAPKPPGVSQITQTSAYITSAYPTTEPRPILEYEFNLWLWDPNRRNWVNGFNRSYPTPIWYSAGMQPGKTYATMARMRNQSGWGPWSGQTEFTTVAGAIVVHNGAFYKAVPYVKHNGVWKMAMPYYNSNGTWRQVLS